MRFKPLVMALSATFVAGTAVLPPSALAQEVQVAGTPELRALPGVWLVELKNKPAADGTSAAVLKAEKDAFRADAARAGASFTERFAYGTLWNGLSIVASDSDIQKIKSLQGVAAVWPVAIIDAPTPTQGAAPDLATAITMTGADRVQSELGFTGKGVKVAVMDTGIDIDHPDFGGNGTNGSTPFPTTRVAYGWDFVGNAFNADPASSAYNPTPTPDANPDDCAGHGSHVAGIIGANGTVKGVAPEATLGAYRVFGCAGSTTADIMIAAMERVLSDGMQVLNMSLGSSFQWPQYPTAEASDRLVNKGVVVVASIGNNGASGLYAAGAPGLGKKVIGTASFDNTYVTQAAFAISPDNRLIGYNLATGAPPPPASGTSPIATNGTPASPADGCAALPAGSLAGKIALIRRGTCTFYVKASNAQAAGAIGVVLYNNAAGALNPTVAGSPAITIPVVAITAADGATIYGRIPGVTLTWGTSTVSAASATGGLISSFSSYGLSPDLALKPDIGAPGGNIWSTYPLELGRYANLSGTSMASPHLAGTVALLLQAKPRTNSQIARTILQNTSLPKVWGGNPGLGLLDNVHRQGAGMVQIDAAILATTKVEPGKIAAGESQSGPFVQVLTVSNEGKESVTYDLSFDNALSTGANTFTPSFTTSDASVAFSSPTVVVPAGGSVSVTATITPATAPVGGQYGGYIKLMPQGGGQVYRVPFAGYIGDYQARAVLTAGFPLLGKLNSCNPPGILRGLDCFGGGSFGLVAAGFTYTMANAFSVPNFLVHFDHHSRLFRVEIFDEKGRAWHRAFDEDYLPRNTSATGFYAFPWNGTTVNGNRLNTLPDGTYYAKISVLKALGDASNPAHWEYWTSPMFKIDRP